MSRFISSLMRKTTLSAFQAHWIAAAILLLFTHEASAQVHMDLSAAIGSGNSALSEQVYGVQTTAYAGNGNLHIAGDGEVFKLDVHASEFGSIDFASDALNLVNTMIIRFDNANQATLALNSEALNSLENLANVVLLFTYDVQASEAASLSLGSLPAGVNSYYSISIPE